MGPKEVALLRQRVAQGQQPWAAAAQQLAADTPLDYAPHALQVFDVGWNGERLMWAETSICHTPVTLCISSPTTQHMVGLHLQQTDRCSAKEPSTPGRNTTSECILLA
jgi:hypothetical protein